MEKRLDVVVAAKALGIEATDRQLKSLARTLRETQGGGGRGFFGGLQSGLGRGSTFKESFELLAGGGAVAGLGLAGSVLNQAADKARDIALDFSLGRKSGGEMVEELAKSIPIYGNIIAAGRTFRGIIDGTTIATARLNEENKKTAELLQVQDQLLKGIREGTGNPSQIQAGAAEQRRALQHELDDIRAGAGGNGDANRIRQQLGVMGFSVPEGDRSARAREIEGEIQRLAKVEAAALKNARELQKKEFSADLLGERADLLKQIPGKQLEAEKESIREKFAREELSLGKRLRDPNLDDSQRKLLGQMIEMLPSLQAEAIRNLQNQPAPANRTQFQNSAFLTGAGDAASRKQDQAQRTFDAMKKLLELIATYLRPAASTGGGPQLGGTN